MTAATRFALSVLLAATPLAAQTSSAATGPPIPADSVAAARRALDARRAEILAASRMPVFERATGMIRLGLLDEADALLRAAGTRDAAVATAEGRLLLARHRYRAARERVDEALRLAPGHRDALLLRGRLEIQTWDLPAAAVTAGALLAAEQNDAAAALLLGRVRLLEKDYAGALEWARRVQRSAPGDAGGYLLEADTRFWDQDPAGAEAPLVRALELDPFDADARFAYGYAIWRRVDATQLADMAAQWDLALAVDPLHYITHWHWGNGHTDRTYADYAQPGDSIVRAQLAAADRLISEGRVPEAVALTRAVEREHPQSVLPEMMRGSAWYMAGDLPRAERLDSAQAAFTRILGRRAHYGPAHNGLAAVIKQRQFQFLQGYDSLEAAIAATPLPADARFTQVFDDLSYYPGDRVLRMARQQLGPTEAYIPMLHRLGLSFTIPPLHVDLAQAMDRPSFRFTTTFDNRQWMDIRGVGGGATGIEYVERGSHQERNVLLHEYAHLFHGNVLTDAEIRRIRALYHAAMEGDRTLDYYAANNESEFLAQAFEAYVMPAKVHPLNHKSMNTVADLRARDPVLFAFIDSMAVRQRSFLLGDTLALRSNWAHVYVALARQRSDDNAENGPVRALAALDTALLWDDRYLPAYLARASVLGTDRDFESAEGWLDRAESIDPRYAPILVARAALVAGRLAAGLLTESEALTQRTAFYQRALALEEDLAERASLNDAFRTMLAQHGLVHDAIRVADGYAATAPTISTYLRDRRDEARAFALALRASIGYATEAVDSLGALVARKPFNYQHRLQYADALEAAGRTADAYRVLDDAQRVLRAAGQPRADYTIRMAALQLSDTLADSARALIEPLLGRLRPFDGDVRLIRVLARSGLHEDATRLLESAPAPALPLERANLAHASALVRLAAADTTGAQALLLTALEENPYDADARLALVRLLASSGRAPDARALIAEGGALELPLGPDFQRRAEAALGSSSQQSSSHPLRPHVDVRGRLIDLQRTRPMHEEEVCVRRTCSPH